MFKYDTRLVLLLVGNVAKQNAKKVLSDSPGLVDFSVGLVYFIHHLPNGQVNFWTFLVSRMMKFI